MPCLANAAGPNPVAVSDGCGRRGRQPSRLVASERVLSDMNELIESCGRRFAALEQFFSSVR
jgi:hypothetical protein